jgi:hypothetical protein
MTDLSSRQRGCPTCTRQKLSIKQEEISVYEPQKGLDTKTDRLTDSQLQCDFDFCFHISVNCSFRQRVTQPCCTSVSLRLPYSDVLREKSHGQASALKNQGHVTALTVLLRSNLCWDIAYPGGVCSLFSRALGKCLDSTSVSIYR